MTSLQRSGSQDPLAGQKPPRAERRPVHVAVAIGLGTGVYAFSLATVTALQAETDRALIADREPVAAAIGLLADHHDGLAASLETARLRYAAATDAYGDLAGGLDALHAQLNALGASIQSVEAMRFSVPGLTAAIPRAAGGGVRTAPARSGLSSQTSSGGTSSGGSGGAASIVASAPVVAAVPVVAPPPPPPAAPPPTQATTGASGAP